MDSELWDAIVYEGLQRLTARHMGQVECGYGHHDDQWLVDGGACPSCRAAV